MEGSRRGAGALRVVVRGAAGGGEVAELEFRGWGFGNSRRGILAIVSAICGGTFPRYRQRAQPKITTLKVPTESPGASTILRCSKEGHFESGRVAGCPPLSRLGSSVDRRVSRTTPFLPPQFRSKGGFKALPPKANS